MNLRTAINLRMHAGICPTAGSLGECAGIWHEGDHGTLAHFSAAVYLWSAAEALPFATVASWFQDLGAVDVVVLWTMHDVDNETTEGRCSDGARALLVKFDIDRESARLRGMFSEPVDGTGVPPDKSESDMFAPLELEAAHATAASRDLTARLHMVMRAGGVKAGQSYVLGALIAAVAGARVTFGDDSLIRRILDTQMDLALPDDLANSSQRRH